MNTKRPLLSILICTLPEPDRIKSYNSLESEIRRQISEIPNGDDLIEIISDAAPRGSILIGGKRNGLRDRASGIYVEWIDDDDMIARNFVQLMIEGCRTGKDIITFDMDYYIDGKYNKTYVINRFIGCDLYSKHWAVNYNPTHRFTVDRTFYHLCAVKKELADQCPFIDANNAEDVGYSDALIPLIKSEFRIEHRMLDINFSTTKIQNV